MYRAPVPTIAFTLRHAADFEAARSEGIYGDLGADDLDAVLEEAGKFAGDVLAPLNIVGDRHGTPFKDSIGKAVTHGCIRLSDEDITWLYQHVGRDILVGSISGGTDVCTAFVES